MTIELRYFTGTGNSWKVIHDAGEAFVRAGQTVNLLKIDPNEHEIHADIIGFAFPVYAFGMPHIIREYFKALNIHKYRQKVFILITSGEVSGSSSTSKKSADLLVRKNFDLIYSEVIKMPHNWITFSHPSPEDANKASLAAAENKVEKIVADILAGNRSLYDVRRTSGILRLLGNMVNGLFRLAGRQKLRDWFRVYDSCDGCGLCADACPVKCIEMKGGKPAWTGSCEQCMRCVCICPQEAIYQKMGGHTRGKKRFFAPGFDPLEH